MLFLSFTVLFTCISCVRAYTAPGRKLKDQINESDFEVLSEFEIDDDSDSVTMTLGESSSVTLSIVSPTAESQMHRRQHTFDNYSPQPYPNAVHSYLPSPARSQKSITQVRNSAERTHAYLSPAKSQKNITPVTGPVRNSTFYGHFSRIHDDLSPARSHKSITSVRNMIPRNSNEDLSGETEAKEMNVILNKANSMSLANRCHIKFNLESEGDESSIYTAFQNHLKTWKLSPLQFILQEVTKTQDEDVYEITGVFYYNQRLTNVQDVTAKWATAVPHLAQSGCLLYLDDLQVWEDFSV